MKPSAIAAALAALPALVNGQSCPLKPKANIQPSVASGYTYQVVATGLARPRGIALDGNGNLLVVEAGKGVISGLRLTEQNGCVTASSPLAVTPNATLNHGIEISTDGKTLYGSSANTAWSWAYDSRNLSTSGQRTLVTNMSTTDDTTRTLLLSRKAPGMLVISRGSFANLDLQAADVSSGHSQIKAFNVGSSNGTAYSFDNDGLLLGWGLRNSVGVGEQPVTGGIYSAECSADQIVRDGVDVHQNNPAEEMNFLGYLNGTRIANQGANFGYPFCLSTWNTSALPNNNNLTVGRQFAVSGTSNVTLSASQVKTDAYCAGLAAPRLSFQAHMAPLDIKFNNSGREAYFAFHGSTDRARPAGYKVSYVRFDGSGEPVEPPNSMTAITDIFGNANISSCPSSCLRPVAMAVDAQGRIFVSSDSTGEIYLITRTANANVSSPVDGHTGAASSLSSSWQLAVWATLTAAVALAMI